ncbi:MAG: glycosyltransferase family 4 protein [Candidatus Marinimicrobia bacterium]|jgi:glycosyltransferase involved in cell wall biosynthesis|nr:glycosyltransferase family 4 protein [Candidatus Neomarinimicrobiota bacterium]
MGGVQHSTLLLAEYLWLTGQYDIETLLPNSGPFADKLSQKSIPIIFYKPISYKSTSKSFFNDRIRIPNPIAWAWNLSAILLNIIRIKKNIKSTTDLVITKGLINHFASGLACERLNIPVICHLQDLITNRYFGLMNIIFNIFAKIIPNYIICDGQSIQNQLNNSVLPKTKVILNGINVSDLKRSDVLRNQIRNEFGISKDAYVIGHVGRMTPWKGQEALLNAFIDYSSINENAYLFLVGTPLFDNDLYYNSIIKILESHSLMHRVIMPGYRNDLQSLFSAMDLFLYPSLEKDTSPLALISAISSGLAVGMSTIDSLSEIADKCNYIDIFNPKKLDEMSALMKKYENDEIRKKIGLLNREAGKNNFDISIHGQKFQRIIEQNRKGI